MNEKLISVSYDKGTMSKKPKPRGDDAAESSDSGRTRKVNDLLLQMLYGSYENTGTDFQEGTAAVVSGARKVMKSYPSEYGDLGYVTDEEIKSALQAARATRAHVVEDMTAKVQRVCQIELDQLRMGTKTHFMTEVELRHSLRTRASVPGERSVGYHKGHITDKEIKRAYITFWVPHREEIDVLEGSNSFIDDVIQAVVAVADGVSEFLSDVVGGARRTYPVGGAPSMYPVALGFPGHGMEDRDPRFGQLRDDGHFSETDAERMARHMRMSDVD